MPHVIWKARHRDTMFEVHKFTSYNLNAPETRRVKYELVIDLGTIRDRKKFLEFDSMNELCNYVDDYVNAMEGGGVIR